MVWDKFNSRNLYPHRGDYNPHIKNSFTHGPPHFVFPKFTTPEPQSVQPELPTQNNVTVDDVVTTVKDIVLTAVTNLTDVFNFNGTTAKVPEMVNSSTTDSVDISPFFNDSFYSNNTVLVSATEGTMITDLMPTNITDFIHAQNTSSIVTKDMGNNTILTTITDTFTESTSKLPPSSITDFISTQNNHSILTSDMNSTNTVFTTISEAFTETASSIGSATEKAATFAIETTKTIISSVTSPPAKNDWEHDNQDVIKHHNGTPDVHLYDDSHQLPYIILGCVLGMLIVVALALTVIYICYQKRGFHSLSESDSTPIKGQNRTEKGQEKDTGTPSVYFYATKS